MNIGTASNVNSGAVGSGVGDAKGDGLDEGVGEVVCVDVGVGVFY